VLIIENPDLFSSPLNKKKPVSSKGNRLFKKGTLKKHCFFGSPAVLLTLTFDVNRIRGFVPPGYPEFTFSETPYSQTVKDLSPAFSLPLASVLL